MKLLFADNARSNLAGSISNTATTAALTAGSGALFPAPANGQFFKGTFIDAATGQQHEIVHVTDVTGDTITMVRAQEGTVAQAWTAGDFFGNLHTAGAMQPQPQITNFAGDPNGSVPGMTAIGSVLADFVWDTTNHILWICVIGGNAATAQWYALAGGQGGSVFGTNFVDILDTPGSGNYTVPAGTIYLSAVLIGGGGGSTDSSALIANGSICGAGGGGTCITPRFAVTPASLIPYVVGAGGAKDVYGGTGGTGGTTSFTGSYSATGGTGSSFAGVGFGGTGFGGQINLAGGVGIAAGPLAGDAGGSGGASMYLGASGGAAGVGIASAGFVPGGGAGGPGSATTQLGQAGAHGRIYIFR